MDEGNVFAPIATMSGRQSETKLCVIEMLDS